MQCELCGQDLLAPIVLTVSMGGPQTCGPCIDDPSRGKQKKNSDELTKQELDDLLDLIGHGITDVLRENLTDELGFILVIGKNDYRGMVSYGSTRDKIPYFLRRAADRIESDQQEW